MKLAKSSISSSTSSVDPVSHVTNKPRRNKNIAPIQEDRTRAVTLLKRRIGLFKKAYELSVLCACDIGIVIFAPNGKLFEFTSSGDMDSLLLRYADYNKPHEVKCNQDFVDDNDGGPLNGPIPNELDDDNIYINKFHPSNSSSSSSSSLHISSSLSTHTTQETRPFLPISVPTSSHFLPPVNNEPSRVPHPSHTSYCQLQQPLASLPSSLSVSTCRSTSSLPRHLSLNDYSPPQLPSTLSHPSNIPSVSTIDHVQSLSQHTQPSNSSFPPPSATVSFSDNNLFPSYAESPQTCLPPLMSTSPLDRPSSSHSSLLAQAITEPNIPFGKSSQTADDGSDSKKNLSYPLLEPSYHRSSSSFRFTNKRSAPHPDSEECEISGINQGFHFVSHSSHKRTKPNFCRKQPFSLKVQIPMTHGGNSSPLVHGDNIDCMDAALSPSAYAAPRNPSPSMNNQMVDNNNIHNSIHQEPNLPSSHSRVSYPKKKSPPVDLFANPNQTKYLQMSGDCSSAQPDSAFPMSNPISGLGNPRKGPPYTHYIKGMGSSGMDEVASSSTTLPNTTNSYPGPISASAIPSPSTFFNRLPLPVSTEVDGGNDGPTTHSRILSDGSTDSFPDPVLRRTTTASNSPTPRQVSTDLDIGTSSSSPVVVSHSVVPYPDPISSHIDIEATAAPAE